jgi:hypothetical protein
LKIMEKEDKIIKEFLEKGFFEKAPEGFTNKVMLSVEQVELQPKPEIFSGILGYVLLTVGAIAVAFGILFYFDNGFIVSYFQSFSFDLSGLANGFSKTGKYFLTLPSHFPYLGLVAGIFVAIFALLGIERFVFSRKNLVNVFV